MEINIAAYNIFLFLLESNVSHSTINVIVKSHLKVPSFIYLEHTQFTSNKNVSNILSFKLHNPYIYITSCRFLGYSLEIISSKYYFKQQIFYVKIMQSSFSDSSRFGDGGAFYVYSVIQQSNVYLYYTTFVRNIAKKSSQLNHGRGGAFFADGDLMFITIEHCGFKNNFAHESGDALYTSKGITLSITESYFERKLTETVSLHPVMHIFGPMKTLQATIEIGNKYDAVDMVGTNVLIISSISEELSLSVHCPQWHEHHIEYDVVFRNRTTTYTNQPQGILENIEFECGVCGIGMYSVSSGNNMVSYPGNLSKMSLNKGRCVKCPYGAICPGNDVLPRPNYWGFWYEGKLAFHVCPAGYCCSGKRNAPCKVYNYCANNRTGILCGSCKKGFSISILTGKCMPDSKCGRDQWFWFLVILATMAYAVWYTFKDDLFIFISTCMSKPNRYFNFRKERENMIECVGYKSSYKGNDLLHSNVISNQSRSNICAEDQNKNGMDENTYL